MRGGVSRQTAEAGAATQAGGGKQVRHGLGSFTGKEALRIHRPVTGQVPIFAAFKPNRSGGKALSQQVYYISSNVYSL
jgi:hypothetical protein